ncbi:hypothetical protein DPMN_123762 [Dreissena polymorpha]|uniref:Uncharacterized protein n=1 Tax=Dreissena polymorpha TaxID=45954 RepID=A0A9D4GS81_DREPO|nr:hypothetical protein DPMN_123762 [Dreissena polymorpha]
MNLLTKKNAPPLGSHVFQANVTFFELIQDIIETNFLTTCHEDWAINVASREKCPAPWQLYWTINVASRVLTRKIALPPGGHVFSPIWTIFELIREINETNVLTKIHDDWAKFVTSRVFTRNTAPPLGGHTNILTKLHEDWASNVTSTVFKSFELSRGINDQTINVASRVFTRQNVDNARRTTDKRQSQNLTMSTLCSGELKRAINVATKRVLTRSMLTTDNRR